MAELQILQRFMNPWALHLQKLGLELKCPSCLNLLIKPMVLPCNHLFCNLCIPRATQFGSECPACKHQYDYRETRPAPYIENIVSIYRNLDTTFNTSDFQPFFSEQSPVFAIPTNNRVKKEPSEAPNDGVTDGGNVLSLKTNDCNYALLNASDKDHFGSTKESDEVAIASWKLDMSNVGLETEEIDMNLVPELSPDSPPSFGNSSDPSSRNCSVGKNTAKRSTEHLMDAAGGDTTQRLLKDTIFVKRQKTLDYSLSEAGVGSNGHSTEKVSYTDNIAVSQSSLRPKHKEHLSVAQSTTVSDSSDFNRGNCAFCHSFKITDGTGAMMYYSNGKEVEGDYSMFSNVIPVHSKCIEWTPRVFYEGEAIKNLESELGRAAKLKCSSCGKKGAALGCFAKSCRRTYHVPCAFEIRECRWDCGDFLMLCPSHNSFKFPREKSKSGKSACRMKNPVFTDSSKITSNESKLWTSLHGVPQEWVLGGSALSSEEKYLLVKFADKCGATVSKFWRPNVTHVVAATDEKGACTRTLKVLMAILNGRWILTMDWIKACMVANCPVNEEPYEVGLDNHGCHNGPKTGRLRMSNNEPKLFDGLKFYFSGDFLPAYKVDLLDLVRTAGGTIIDSMEELMQSHDMLATCTAVLVVYNLDPLQGCAVGAESSVVLQRLAEAQHVANVSNSMVIRHTWILESIAGCKLLPFVC